MTEPVEPTPAFEARLAGRRFAVAAPALRSAFIPILLLALAVTAWFAFQTLQLVREQQQITAVQASLAPQELAATKLRTALDQLATATKKLADNGNGNARAIVEQLRNRGVTISPPASAPR